MNHILQEICGLPTSPFCEHAVVEYVRSFARQHRLRVQEDRFGNMLLTARAGSPRWVVVAHMDHPGMVAQRQRGRIIEAEFRGSVLAEGFGKPRVVFFTEKGEVRATVAKVGPDREKRYARKIELRVQSAREVPSGSCGMLDLPVGRQKGKLLYSRALDDLAGVAAALQACLEARRRGRFGFAALLTRGEEEGFIGAIAAARDGRLLRKSDGIVSIECSARQLVAVQGRGVVIRVGDWTSVFDSATTWQITRMAETLAKRKKRFAFQRALMPGGTCEATAFSLYGYRAAAVCVPLGNYHNMDREHGKLGPEYIHLDDWECMVQLLSELANEKPLADLRPLRGKLENRFNTLKHLLG
jgi:endoglucanase